MIEFVLVGIPLIFIIISTFEISRGMWMYHTLAAGVKEGTRYAVVHGQNCSLPPNSCSVTISQIATKIKTAGTGLPADSVTLTFDDAGGNSQSCLLSTCISSFNTAMWPISTENAPGLKIRITGIYKFRSAIAMLWPGAGGAFSMGTINLPASSRESIQF
jgi:hypothetical protein